MQPKQPKAEREETMFDATESFYEWIRGKTMPGMQPSPKECYEAGYHNALAGIPNPEAVRELIEAATSVSRPRHMRDIGTQEIVRLEKAVEALTAPSASPQQK